MRPRPRVIPAPSRRPHQPARDHKGAPPRRTPRHRNRAVPRRTGPEVDLPAPEGPQGLVLDPTVRLKTGEHPTTQPLPLTRERIAQVRELLLSPDPATALVVALIAFHGIRMRHLQDIELTHIVDSRLTVDGRVIPLAEPVRQRLAAWLDHRAARWPHTTSHYLFVNRRSAYRSCPVGTRWLRLAIGEGVTPRELREDRIMAEAHAKGGDVRAIADLFGLSINASSRYAYSLEHDDLSPRRPHGNNDAARD